jgi:hypothetical protein
MNPGTGYGSHACSSHSAFSNALAEFSYWSHPPQPPCTVVPSYTVKLHIFVLSFLEGNLESP